MNRSNLFTNPTFQTNTTGWSAVQNLNKRIINSFFLTILLNFAYIYTIIILLRLTKYKLIIFVKIL